MNYNRLIIHNAHSFLNSRKFYYIIDLANIRIDLNSQNFFDVFFRLFFCQFCIAKKEMEKQLNQEQLTTLWNECLAAIEKSGLLGADQFKAWFLPVKPISFKGNRLDIGVPSAFFFDHLELNYKHILIPTIRKFFGEKVDLFYNYLVAANDESSSMTVKTENQSATVGKTLPREARRNPFEEKKKEIAEEELDSQLNPRYNFANYYVSDCNRLASSIGNAIIDDPRCKTFNPLFIYGDSGVGKTHLMQAIGIGLKERNPKMRVLYTTARLFESHSVYALLHGKMNDFLEFYQSIDCLLIDDIQDLIGKEKTQKALFHIFNHIHLNNKQIILTSDCKPVDMQGMPERLLTRFKWGMTVELEHPDYELRLQVLQQKSLTEGIELPNEVMEFIARNAGGTIRELEGLMVNLMARSTFMNQAISTDLIENILNDTVKARRHEINFETITQKVSNFYNIDPDSLFTKNRHRTVADARQLIMYLAKKHTDMKFKTIGTRMSRNHSTVMHACNSIEARLSIEKKLQRDIEAIEKSFDS